MSNRKSKVTRDRQTSGKGAKTFKPTTGGGGGGAPTTAPFVTVGNTGDLTAERALTEGSAVKITDGGANSNITVSAREQAFITNVTGAGTISNKTYEANTVPSNKILTDADSDNDDITITVQIHVVGDSWQNAWVKASGAGSTPVTVNKENWTELVTNGRIYTASINLTDADATGTITVETSGGASTTFDYTRSLDPPLVTAAVFDTHAGSTGGDPLVDAAQVSTTSVQGTQTVRITGTTESHATKIWVTSAGVSSSEQGSFPVTAGAFDFTINVRSSGGVGAQTATLEAAVGESDTRGATFNTTNTVTVSHTIPTFTGGSQSDIAYPASQAALKNVETCSVTVTHTNAATGDTYLYDDNSTGELTIPSTTTYLATKTSVTRLAGNYRDSGTNYRLAATRTEQNGTSTTKTVTVKIAHVAPTIDITNNGESSPKVFRSKTGGDKTYTITITSDQELEVAPTLSRDTSDDGPVLGTFGGGSKVWTAAITIQEDDTKNVAAATHDFETLVARNNADVTQNTIDSGSSYGVAGFEQRDVAVLKFDQLEPIGTMVSNRNNATKLVMEYVGLGAGTYVTNTTDDPGSKKFTITNSGGTFDAHGDHIKCNDSNIYDATDYTMRIEESA